MYYIFLPFAKQNQAEVWPRFQSMLKILLWPNGVKWKLDASGPLCLWQCFFFAPLKLRFSSCMIGSYSWDHQHKDLREGSACSLLLTQVYKTSYLVLFWISWLLLEWTKDCHWRRRILGHEWTQGRSNLCSNQQKVHLWRGWVLFSQEGSKYEIFLESQKWSPRGYFLWSL